MATTRGPPKLPGPQATARFACPVAPPLCAMYKNPSKIDRTLDFEVERSTTMRRTSIKRHCKMNEADWKVDLSLLCQRDEDL